MTTCKPDIIGQSKKIQIYFPFERMGKKKAPHKNGAFPGQI